jgi:CDP-4-dehydro-6-deoxyglucose reductase
MTVREHLTGLEDSSEQPRETVDATVSAVEPLDRNRTDELRRAVATALEESGRGDWVDRLEDEPPEVDWGRVEELLDRDPDAVDEGVPLDLFRTLHERFVRPYPSLLRIAFDLESPISFAAGQYVSIRFHDVPRVYSVASSPGAEDLELCVRLVPGGRLTPEVFQHLEPGDEVTVRGPFGEFALESPSEPDVAFLATGTGVAPLRSMIDYLFEEGLDRVAGERRDVWLFLGAGWEDDLAYRERFRTLDDEHEDFHFVPTLSRENYLTDWAGETAYVQQTFLKYVDESAVDTAGLGDLDLMEYVESDPALDVDAGIDPEGVEVYACGINAMVYSLLDVLEGVGVPEERVDAEGYG